MDVFSHIMFPLFQTFLTEEGLATHDLRTELKQLSERYGTMSNDTSGEITNSSDTREITGGDGVTDSSDSSDSSGSDSSDSDSDTEK